MEVIAYRTKIALYVFVVVVVVGLLAIRLSNAVQKQNYKITPIFSNHDITISISHPEIVLGPAGGATYPLTIIFTRHNAAPVAINTYTLFLQSSTLLFLNSSGEEIAPKIIFTNDTTSFQQSVTIQPYLSGFLPKTHQIVARTRVGEESSGSHIIEIHMEPPWFSFISLAASSLLEISIASALITWIFGVLDTTLAARKEQVEKIKETLSSLPALSQLNQMEKVRELEDEIIRKNLDKTIRDKIEEIKSNYKEEKFFSALGEEWVQNSKPPNPEIIELYNHFYPSGKYREHISALGRIINQSHQQEDFLKKDLEMLMQLWDGMDIDVKNLIVSALKKLPQNLFSTSTKDSSRAIFSTANRRRLLRDGEVRLIFPQLVDSVAGWALKVDYDAVWHHLPRREEHPKIRTWLKQHNLGVNPFGSEEIGNYPFYPEGFARPNRWEDVLFSFPQHVKCPTPNDAKALTFLLRFECLPRKNVDFTGMESYDPGKEIFPVIVSFRQNAPPETMLVTLARSAANTWMDILPYSPDAMLDLSNAGQAALLELLVWNFGSTRQVLHLLKQADQKDTPAERLLIRKISAFNAEFSSLHLPQDSIFLSWLKIRPPDLNYTYLILPLDEISINAKKWWLEQFNPLISTLSLNGIIVKMFSSSTIPTTLSVKTLWLNWTSEELKTSLDFHFDRAIESFADPTKPQQEKARFIELFGSGPYGYAETESQTTDKLISASHNSLARMLTLGNRLLQYHCETRIKDGIPEKYLYAEDLETILNSA